MYCRDGFRSEILVKTDQFRVEKATVEEPLTSSHRGFVDKDSLRAVVTLEVLFYRDTQYFFGKCIRDIVKIYHESSSNFIPVERLILSQKCLHTGIDFVGGFIIDIIQS